MLTEAQINEFTARVRECLREAFHKWLIFDVKPEDIEIRYDLDGHVAGYSGYKFEYTGIGRARRPHMVNHWLRFNVHAIEHHWDDMVNDTIPHEVAHTVIHINYGDRIISERLQYRETIRKYGRRGRKGAKIGHLRPHGPEWKEVAQSLGCTGTRCHNYATKKSRRTKWYEYRSEHGDIKAMSSIRHGRLQRSSFYHIIWKDTGDEVYGKGWTGRVFWDKELKELVH